MHVLIVEDDMALGHFLGHGLKLDGHEVSVIGDGESALAVAEKLRPEVVILDLGLPEKDGMEVLIELGERFKSTSVLVLTARTEMEDRVKCLELGADDVVQKPFSFHELRARLKAICRRRSRFEETLLHFGDIEMDRVERTVKQSGREIDLTATEFSLMESLLRRRGEHVCSREDLLREVWREPVGMGTNIVEVYINYLRKKLGHGTAKGSGFGTVIRTVRGEGYVLHARSDYERNAGTAARWKEAQMLERKAG